MKEGRIGLGGKASGRHRAIESLARRIADCKIDPAHSLLPLYSYDDGNCQALMRKLGALGVTCAAPCAIGPSIGPNAYGAAFVAMEE